MARSKHFDFREISANDGGRGNEGKIATQLMLLWRACAAFDRPVVLECGTSRGRSTTVLIEACERQGGRLVSVDIKDCSDVVESDRWQFVRSDDSDVDRIVEEAPHLKDGIDLMYVDSVHSRRHVEKLVMSWWPYLKQNAAVFFDDIDPNPYRKGNRKDNYFHEVAWRGISDFTREFFYANEDDLLLELHLGSTGLAKMTKLSPRGSRPRPARLLLDRKEHALALALHRVRKRGRKRLTRLP